MPHPRGPSPQMPPMPPGMPDIATLTREIMESDPEAMEQLNKYEEAIVRLEKAQVGADGCRAPGAGVLTGMRGASSCCSFGLVPPALTARGRFCGSSQSALVSCHWQSDRCRQQVPSPPPPPPHTHPTHHPAGLLR